MGGRIRVPEAREAVSAVIASSGTPFARLPLSGGVPAPPRQTQGGGMTARRSESDQPLFLARLAAEYAGEHRCAAEEEVRVRGGRGQHGMDESGLKPDQR